MTGIDYLCASLCAADAIWWTYLISWQGGMLWIAGACVAIYINRKNA